MKKLLILPILFLSCLQISGIRVPPPTTCVDNGWVEIYGQPKKKKYPNRDTIECVLPDGEMYSPWVLGYNDRGEYNELFERYSGKSPTSGQVEKAKEELRKNGYIVE